MYDQAYSTALKKILLDLIQKLKTNIFDLFIERRKEGKASQLRKASFREKGREFEEGEFPDIESQSSFLKNNQNS